MPKPCHGSGNLLPVSDRGGPVSLPGQSVCNLWRTKWHWQMFLPEFFGFTLSVSLHCGFLYLYITWGMNKGPVFNRSSGTQSHHIDMNNKKLTPAYDTVNVFSPSEAKCSWTQLGVSYQLRKNITLWLQEDVQAESKQVVNPCPACDVL
jgi:hypothetical protein